MNLKVTVPVTFWQYCILIGSFCPNITKMLIIWETHTIYSERSEALLCSTKDLITDDVAQSSLPRVALSKKKC